jgi:hypothetical protein
MAAGLDMTFACLLRDYKYVLSGRLTMTFNHLLKFSCYRNLRETDLMW